MTTADVRALIDATGTPPHGPADGALDDEVRTHLHAAASVLRAATALDPVTVRTYVRAAGLIVDRALNILDKLDGRE